jgi:hypothetical protein
MHKIIEREALDTIRPGNIVGEMAAFVFLLWIASRNFTRTLGSEQSV